MSYIYKSTLKTGIRMDVNLQLIQRKIYEIKEYKVIFDKDQEGYEKQFDEIYLAIAELSVRNKTLRPRKPIGFVQEENQDS